MQNMTSNGITWIYNRVYGSEADASHRCGDSLKRGVKQIAF